MKYCKSLLLCLIVMMCCTMGYSQLQKGNVLLGADIGNLDLSLNTGSNFAGSFNPKAAWFIKDNFAVGGYILFGLSTAKNEGTSIYYGVGPLVRYYFSNDNKTLLNHTRFFAEGNVGIQGSNPHVGNSTNGLGLGIGPGIVYFITPNVGLEALIKYQGIVGFGSSVTTSDITGNFGVQIYLPHKTVEQAAHMEHK